jgi:GT2 family glycosyltransferase
MPYNITEIELTQPLPTISLSESNTGIGLILRRKEKPIGFLMQALPAKSVLTPEDLGQFIAKEVGTKLLEESIREELIAKADLAPLPSLTVAICTKDRPEDLTRCLNHLLALKSVDTMFEVLVVDNAPSDERTQQLCSVFSEVHYVREMKPGLGFARNRALEEATGEMIAFIDDDVVVDRNWWRGLMEAIAENPDAAAFTGLVLPYELATQAQILFEQRGGFRRGFEKIRYGQTLPGNSLYPCGSGIFGAGCNMAFRREILLKLGGFDEALAAPRPGGDDLDIFYRVIREGYSLVYEPQYMVFHRHRREYEKLRHQYWTWGLGLMAFTVKTYISDAPKRFQLSKIILWWFKDELRQIKQCLKNQHPLPLEMILAEFWGGVVGILGEYPRSLRRAARIRQKYS